jgi:hypothetical protein
MEKQHEARYEFILTLLTVNQSLCFYIVRTLPPSTTRVPIVLARNIVCAKEARDMDF